MWFAAVLYDGLSAQPLPGLVIPVGEGEIILGHGYTWYLLLITGIIVAVVGAALYVFFAMHWDRYYFPASTAKTMDECEPMNDPQTPDVG